MFIMVQNLERTKSKCDLEEWIHSASHCESYEHICFWYMLYVQAAHYGNESIAELLLDKGANVNFQARHNIRFIFGY